MEFEGLKDMVLIRDRAIIGFVVTDRFILVVSLVLSHPFLQFNYKIIMSTSKYKIALPHHILYANTLL